MRCAVEERFSKSLQCTRGRWKRRAGGAGKGHFFPPHFHHCRVFDILWPKKNVCVHVRGCAVETGISTLPNWTLWWNISTWILCVAELPLLLQPDEKDVNVEWECGSFEIHSIWIQGNSCQCFGGFHVSLVVESKFAICLPVRPHSEVFKYWIRYHGKMTSTIISSSVCTSTRFVFNRENEEIKFNFDDLEHILRLGK